MSEIRQAPGRAMGTSAAARPAPSMADRLKTFALRSPWPVYILGFLPAVAYFWWGLNDRLGPDPVRTFEHVLGLWALRFLILTLAITPLRHLAGINLVRYRRALGLLVFWYVVMHFSVYAFLDKALDLTIILQDIIRRPFITIGMAGLVLLIPLALTSNSWSIRRLGINWNRLHKLGYLIAALGSIHYLMSVKTWPGVVLIHVAAIAVLLAFRPLARFIPKAKPRRF